MTISGPPGDQLLPRRAAKALREAIADTRVVLVNGARQGGKSTLVQQIAADLPQADWRSLDDPAVLRAARADPTGFVQSEGTLVIDEIQRAPELLLPIKARVDRRPRQPGQFILTGSAQVFGLKSVPDTLPGRVETIELWPFSQGEIAGRPDGLVDALFRLGPDLRHDSPLQRSDYADLVVQGGLPESVARKQERRRSRFLTSYVTQLVDRDVSQVGTVERAAQFRALTELVAARSGQLLVPAALGAAVGLTQNTVARYLDLLELMFLIKRVPAWSRNLSTRITAAPKAAMVDSGVAANIIGADAAHLARYDGQLGGLLESFVLMELARQLSWSDTEARLSHYRTRDGVEVDAVLEDRGGRVVAIEVKAAATVRTEDFRGLRHLQHHLGDDFVVGVVLYTGQQTLPFGPGLRAMPVSAVWDVEAAT